jgi:hypothetical protein
MFGNRKAILYLRQLCRKDQIRLPSYRTDKVYIQYSYSLNQNNNALVLGFRHLHKQLHCRRLHLQNLGSLGNQDTSVGYNMLCQQHKLYILRRRLNLLQTFLHMILSRLLLYLEHSNMRQRHRHRRPTFQ